jgi:nucleotide-binding universal stress UspA family protein
MLPYKKILCPIDFSEPSYEALKAANELAEHFQATLYLMHVIQPIPALQSPMKEFNVAVYQSELEKAAQQSLDTTIGEKTSKSVRLHPIIAHGDAANEVLNAVKKEKIDLLVIATHGRTGLTHLVFGSVAEKVVRHAPCPVLTIRVGEDE